jgi:hypothetical protein
MSTYKTLFLRISPLPIRIFKASLT